MREDEVRAGVLARHRIALGVIARRPQQLPLRSRQSVVRNAAIEVDHPGRQGVRVVAARRETSAGEPIDVAARAPDRQDRAAIFARHRQHLRRGVARENPVVQRRAVEAPRRRAGSLGADQRRRRIRDAAIVGDDLRVYGLATGKHRRVAGRSLGVRVVLPRMRKERRAAMKARQPARQLRAEPVEIIPPKLIHRDQHHERRTLGGDRGLLRGGQGWRGDERRS